MFARRVSSFARSSREPPILRSFVLTSAYAKTRECLWAQATGFCRFRFADPRQSFLAPSNPFFFPYAFCGRSSREPPILRSFVLTSAYAKTRECLWAFPCFWRRRRDSNPRGVSPKRFSRPPRYDRFDTPASSFLLLYFTAKKLSMIFAIKNPTKNGRGFFPRPSCFIL